MAILWDFFSVFPANAGMILKHCIGLDYKKRVPRECGDDPELLSVSCWGGGSVPRECGDDPIRLLPHSYTLTVFPANAGMILAIAIKCASGYSVPRECGDDPKSDCRSVYRTRCSPRMRG